MTPSFAGILVESGASASLTLFPWPSSPARVEAAAADASRNAADATAIHADAVNDAYALARYEGGRLARRIAFRRDAEEGEQWTLEGAPAAWEADLLFSLPVDDFIAYLSDDDGYADADLERARTAHAAKDAALVGRRPPLLAASLREWLRKKGVDPRAPNEVIKPPTLWERLFGWKDG